MLVDVLRYETPGGGESYRACEAGRGAGIVDAHRAEARKHRLAYWLVGLLVGAVLAVYGVFVAGQVAVTLVALGVLGVVWIAKDGSTDRAIPTVVEESMRLERARRRYDLDVVPDGAETIPS